jgi:hypothetical protein
MVWKTAEQKRDFTLAGTFAHVSYRREAFRRTLLGFTAAGGTNPTVVDSFALANLSSVAMSSGSMISRNTRFSESHRPSPC